jgi:hypothetical protein
MQMRRSGSCNGASPLASHKITGRSKMTSIASATVMSEPFNGFAENYVCDS